MGKGKNELLSNFATNGDTLDGKEARPGVGLTPSTKLFPMI